MGFSRPEYWSGLSCPPPGDLPTSGIEPVSLMSPALADGFFTTSTTWEARHSFLVPWKLILKCFYSSGLHDLTIFAQESELRTSSWDICWKQLSKPVLRLEWKGFHILSTECVLGRKRSWAKKNGKVHFLLSCKIDIMRFRHTRLINMNRVNVPFHLSEKSYFVITNLHSRNTVIIGFPTLLVRGIQTME